MKTFKYNITIVRSIFVGLIDSDGCLTWHWTTEKTFCPSVSITLKLNRNILQFVKTWLGGSVTSNGNWQHNSIKTVGNVCLPILFPNLNNLSSCLLITSKRYDALLLGYIMTTFVLNDRKHRRKQAQVVLVDMRRYLHFGKTRSGAKTTLELEQRLELTPGSSKDCAKTKAKELEKAFELQMQLQKSKVLNQDYLDAWQVVGFSLGDGGVHVIWGTKVITTTIHFTGDRRSSLGLEIYTASMIRDGIYRKAWQSSQRDVSRLVVHGVDMFANKITSFFTQYPMPPCKKQEIFDKISETAVFLASLKQKQIKAQPWTAQDWKTLDRLIQETWTLNPSGKERQFKNPEAYLKHLKTEYAKNKLKIR